MSQPLGTGAAFLLWLGAVVVLRRWRTWLPYYFVATVGFTVFAVLLGRDTVEPWLAALTAHSASALANGLGMNTRIFSGAVGAILVLVIRQPVGWTLLNVGVECSGLLEGAALAGLTLFYPLWGPGRRLALLAAALVATEAANILRVLTIIGLLHWGGKDFLLVAHSLVGRGIFFVVVLGLYWLTLTLPTIDVVARRLRA